MSAEVDNSGGLLLSEPLLAVWPLDATRALALTKAGAYQLSRNELEVLSACKRATGKVVPLRTAESLWRGVGTGPLLERGLLHDDRRIVEVLTVERNGMIGSTELDCTCVLTRNPTGELVRRAVRHISEASDGCFGKVMVFSDQEEQGLKGPALVDGHIVTGRRHAEEWSRRCAAALGIDPSLILWAIAPRTDGEFSAGAMRNRMLLRCAGKRYLQLDDDIVPLSHIHQGSTPGMCVSGDIDGHRMRWCGECEDVPLKELWRVSESAAASHAQCLGRSVGESMRRALEECELWLNNVSFDDLRVAVQSNARIRCSFSGFYGDCASDTPFRRLLLDGPERRDLVKAERAYQRRVLGRGVMRYNLRDVIARPSVAATAGVMGCDATSLLPPFFPFGRAEESVWACVLRRCDQSAHAMYLRTLLHHDPPKRPRFEWRQLWQDCTRWRQADVLCCMLESMADVPSLDVATRMRAFGRALTEVSRLSDREWHVYVLGRMKRVVAAMLAKLLQLLSEYRRNPAWWGRDVDVQVRRAEEFVRQTGDVQVADAPNIRVFRERVALYGQLLCAWPDVFEFARTSRMEVA